MIRSAARAMNAAKKKAKSRSPVRRQSRRKWSATATQAMRMAPERKEWRITAVLPFAKDQPVEQGADAGQRDARAQWLQVDVGENREVEEEQHVRQGDCGKAKKAPEEEFDAARPIGAAEQACAGQAGQGAE